MKGKFVLSALFVLAYSFVLAQETPTPQPKDDVNVACKSVCREERPGWMERHKALTENLANNECEVLFIGDSITHQWESGGKIVWETILAPYKPANFGIGGDRTEHVLWRIEDSQLKTPKSPKLCFIHIGTNNTGHFKGAQDPNLTAKAVKLIADKVIEAYPNTHVVILSIFPRGKTADDKLRKHNDLVNAELVKIKSKNISVVDIGKNFLKEDGSFLEGTAPDLLHFSPKGYIIWAQSIMPYIHRYVGVREPVIQPSNPGAPSLSDTTKVSSKK